MCTHVIAQKLLKSPDPRIPAIFLAQTKSQELGWQFTNTSYVVDEVALFDMCVMFFHDSAVYIS